jgi:hypothetical protein
MLFILEIKSLGYNLGNGMGRMKFRSIFPSKYFLATTATWQRNWLMTGRSYPWRMATKLTFTTWQQTKFL